MTIERAYLTYLQLVNRNFTNDNVDVDRSRFIIAFNYVQQRYVEWILEKRNEDDLRDLQELLVLDAKLVKQQTVLNHCDYTLPLNYFNLSSLKVFGSKQSCKDVRLFTHEIKNDNVEEYLADCHNEPSFDYQETFYTLNSGTVSVYFKNFDITKTHLSYYRYPTEVNISGFIDLEGNDTVDIDPEFSDRIVHRILIAMSKDYSAINDESNKYQIDKDRLFSKI